MTNKNYYSTSTFQPVLEDMCVRPDTRDKEATDAATTSMSKLVAVTSKNQDLKNTLLAYQTQCESLEDELRFQTAKAAELQDLLALKSNADMDGLTSRLLTKSLAVAERSLEIDEMKMKLQDAQREKHMMDQEREASVQMMAELTKVIREQQIEIKRQETECNPVESEFERLWKQHDRLMASEHRAMTNVPLWQGASSMGSNEKQNANLLHELEMLRSERDALVEKSTFQKITIATLKQKSQEREANNIALVQDLKQQYEEDRTRLGTIQRSLEAEIQVLKEEKEEINDMLYGEMIQLKAEENILVGKSFIMRNGVFKVYDSDDESAITESTMYTSTESDPSGPTGSMEFATERIVI